MLAGRRRLEPAGLPPKVAETQTVGANPTTGVPLQLAVRAGRPIVPVHIKGTGRLWPQGQKRIYTGETKTTFGAPIMP